MILDWISWWRMIGHIVFTFSRTSSWLTLTLPHPHFFSSLPRSYGHTHEYKMAEILRQHSRTGTNRDDYHYSASSKYSNSIRGDTKGLIRADELPSRVPFFLLLLIAAISGCVGEMRTDNSPLSNEPIFHVYPQRGDVPGRCHSKTACGVHTHRGWMLNVVHFIVECHTPCAEKSVLMFWSFHFLFNISNYC